MTRFDPNTLRTAFGSFMTGVTVVTTMRDDGTPVGFTANSFSSVSLDPPLILVCPGKFLSSYDSFTSCTHFAVNILAEGQEDVSNTFARFKGDRFAITPHSLNADNIPVINGALAQLSCRTHQVVPAGDHSVLIGEVTDLAHTGGSGLGYVGGQYFSLGRERAAFDQTEGVSICGAIILKDNQVGLQLTPDGLRPPQCISRRPDQMIADLHQALITQGVEANLGQAYSVYQDHSDRSHHSYFLADAHRVDPGADMQWIPVPELPQQRFATSSITQMMTRFTRESLTGNFALYLGDTQDGAIQHHPQRT